ncbi:hypothetical protein CAPTEDRAFT_225104 [Capitella teleta]|uniref:CARD domain-containing protein n=1 Tax=Capitella teleta TaxID=283909 RepID=R7TGN7_CAPTE|nr:hypothetical protein CAPTEDRAFT_225104 [Capitella teleta]|eukprot:ELT90270.1 hypothetical protein CAPTEDRAFT_225104 [Capitella teleta]
MEGKLNENTIHGRTLGRNAQFLEKHLDPIKVILYDEGGLIDKKERKHIASRTTKTQQNVAIMNIVIQKGFHGYQTFLRVLQSSKQDQLRNALVKCERVVKLQMQNNLSGFRTKAMKSNTQFSTLEGRPWSRSYNTPRPRSQEGQTFKSCFTALPPRPGSYTGEYLDDKTKLKRGKIRRLSISTLSSSASTISEGECLPSTPVYDPNVWDSSRPLPKCTDVKSSREDGLLVFGYRDSLGRLINDILAIKIGTNAQIVKLGQLGSKEDTMNWGTTCCSFFNIIYISTLGEKCDKIWKFNPDTRQQEECGQVYQPRTGHCMSVAGGAVYLLGGSDPVTGESLNCIEGYDPHGCKGFLEATLQYPVSKACSTAVNNKIYVFGGYSERMSTVNHVQCFDPVTHQCVLLKPLASIAGTLTSHQWGPLVYLIGKHHCMIYDTETEICVIRKGHKTGVDDFGLLTVDVDDDRMVYAVGGRHDTALSTDILGVSLRSISLGKEASWMPKDRLQLGIRMLRSHTSYKLPNFWFDQQTSVQHLQ